MTTMIGVALLTFGMMLFYAALRLWIMAAGAALACAVALCVLAGWLPGW